MNCGKKVEYSKDLIKIRFKSNDDLPINKTIKLCLLTIIIRCIFREDGKRYPQLFLDDALYQLMWKCFGMKKLMLQKELM